MKTSAIIISIGVYLISCAKFPQLYEGPYYSESKMTTNYLYGDTGRVWVTIFSDRLFEWFDVDSSKWKVFNHEKDLTWSAKIKFNPDGTYSCNDTMSFYLLQIPTEGRYIPNSNIEFDTLFINSIHSNYPKIEILKLHTDTPPDHDIISMSFKNYIDPNLERFRTTINVRLKPLN